MKEACFCLLCHLIFIYPFIHVLLLFYTTCLPGHLGCAHDWIYACMGCILCNIPSNALSYIHAWWLSRDETVSQQFIKQNLMVRNTHCNSLYMSGRILLLCCSFLSKVVKRRENSFCSQKGGVEIINKRHANKKSASDW